MNPSYDKHLLLDMQEHPERYSDEQLEQAMAELDKEPDTALAWQKVLSRRTHPQPLSCKEGCDCHSGRKRKLLLSLQGRGRERVRVAAILVAFMFLGFMSLAGYHFVSGWHRTPEVQAKADTTEVVRQRFTYDVQDGDTIFRFENIRLDSILSVVGRHYGREVVFMDNAPKHLRLYITCRTSQKLNDFVETLNVFDGFRITQEFYTLYVEPEETKEDKR